eukprot:Gb_33380 [translate_table: standard]
MNISFQVGERWDGSNPFSNISILSSCFNTIEGVVPAGMNNISKERIWCSALGVDPMPTILVHDCLTGSLKVLAKHRSFCEASLGSRVKMNEVTHFRFLSFKPYYMNCQARCINTFSHKSLVIARCSVFEASRISRLSQGITDSIGAIVIISRIGTGISRVDKSNLGNSVPFETLHAANDRGVISLIGALIVSHGEGHKSEERHCTASPMGVDLTDHHTFGFQTPWQGVELVCNSSWGVLPNLVLEEFLDHGPGMMAHTLEPQQRKTSKS